jgi:hypothetical protein
MLHAVSVALAGGLKELSRIIIPQLLTEYNLVTIFPKVFGRHNITHQEVIA